MKFKLLSLSILLVFIFSCKKEATIQSCDSSLSNSYFPMTVGSYWVYQWYKVDFVEEEETKLEGKIDTIKVLKDTLIGYNNYAVIKDSSSFLTMELSKTIYRRDSLGYLIDPQRNIYFSSNNFVDTLRIEDNSVVRTIYKMEILGSSIETPLGVFDCRNYQGEITYLFSSSLDNQYHNNYYSRGVGKVQSNIFYSSQADRIHFHRRLIEYYIE